MAPITARASTRPSILLVEDDFVLRTGLAELLDARGYAVECAADGLEAFNRLTSRRDKPSLIVLDLMMPYMNGIEFRAMQRSLPAIADVPVVVLTANPRAAVEAEQLQLDVRRTLFKPVDAASFLEVVEELTLGEAP